MQAGILIIGDEILSGNVQDTNSSFATRLLYQNNISVSTILTVGDTENAILEGLGIMLEKVDLLITTGGLGPTKDDITKTALAKFFQSELVLNQSVLDTLEERYAKRGIVLNELNKAQAMVPAIAEVVPNDVGTAPVFWIEQNNKLVITLPGVPREMRYLLENILLKKLVEKFVAGSIVQKTINVIGIPESDLAIKLAAVEEEISKASDGTSKYKLAYLPDLNCIRLQVTGIGPDTALLEKNVNDFKHKIEEAAGKYIFGYEKDTIASKIGEMLKEKNATLSTAESCTGGYLAHLITEVSGSSQYYNGSIISYSNAVKTKELGVKEETLNNFGAVSEETCREMLAGCLEKFGTDYVIATTGIAGPTGGSAEKPVGLVWIGVADKNHSYARSFYFNRSRTENIHLFAISALDMLRRFMGN